MNTYSQSSARQGSTATMPTGSPQDASAGAAADERAPGPLVAAVIGVGTMGRGISLVLADAGHEVRVFDAQPGVADAWAHAWRAEGSTRPRDAGDVRAAVSVSSAVAGCDLVVEVVAEDREVKRAVLHEVYRHAPTTCVVTTNTSSFPIEVLAEDCADPSRFLGTHFFNPAHLIPGVEVIPTAATAPAHLASVVRWLTEAGKRPAVVRSSPGFIANRLQMALLLESLRCVEEGLVTRADLDTVVSTTFGFRLPLFGPFAIADMAGLDVYDSIFENLRAGFGDRFATPDAVRSRTRAGQFGVKTGQGFERYGAEEAGRLVADRDRRYRRLLDVLEER